MKNGVRKFNLLRRSSISYGWENILSKSASVVPRVTGQLVLLEGRVAVVEISVVPVARTVVGPLLVVELGSASETVWTTRNTAQSSPIGTFQNQLILVPTHRLQVLPQQVLQTLVGELLEFDLKLFELYVFGRCVALGTRRHCCLLWNCLGNGLGSCLLGNYLLRSCLLRSCLLGSRFPDGCFLDWSCLGLWGFGGFFDNSLSRLDCRFGLALGSGGGTNVDLGDFLSH